MTYSTIPDRPFNNVVRLSIFAERTENWYKKLNDLLVGKNYQQLLDCLDDRILDLEREITKVETYKRFFNSTERSIVQQSGAEHSIDLLT